MKQARKLLNTTMQSPLIKTLPKAEIQLQVMLVLSYLKLPQMTFQASTMMIKNLMMSYQALTLMLRESPWLALLKRVRTQVSWVRNSQPRIVFPSLGLAGSQANLCIHHAQVGAFPSLVSKVVPGATLPWPMVPRDGDPHPRVVRVVLQPPAGVPHHLPTL